ncbi:myo-inositol monophosphatase [Histoplasma capsulatum var. duboisii H88]|uniref:Myo-inositol monophosphatase n=1 Tax=Ajellomyces capsulatus (strain H88) TaxID=544711 RepID=A0A8A1LQD0_AJEC8|nr:myo-inositol monophosphatase [Histoplasma capsulatum var. duboisii H88]
MDIQVRLRNFKLIQYLNVDPTDLPLRVHIYIFTHHSHGFVYQLRISELQSPIVRRLSPHSP